MNLNAAFVLGVIMSTMSFGQSVVWDLVFPHTTTGRDYALKQTRLMDINGDGVDDVNAGLSTFIIDGATGYVLRDSSTFPAPATGAGFAGGVGDVDGDGAGDYAEVGPLHPTIWPSGSWRLVSGASGAELMFDVGRDNSFAALGDINGDGFADFGKGEWWGISAGWVEVYLGPSFTYDGTIFGVAPLSGFGRTITTLGDVNGDGCDDFVVGADGYWLGSQHPTTNGHACFIDGATRQIQQIWWGLGAYERLGQTVTNLGDVDGDGINDFSIGSKFNLKIISGATRVELFTTSNVYFATGSPNFAYGLGDVDGDGAADYATRLLGNPMVSIYSGRTLQLIREIGWPYPMVPGVSVAFPPSFCGIGDVNGDGFVDICCGALSNTGPPSGIPPHVMMLSLRPPGVQSLGPGCGSGDSVPLFGITGVPRIGTTGAMNLSGVPPSAPAYLVLGYSSTQYMGLPLPIDFGPYQSPGCALRTSIDWDAAFLSAGPGNHAGSVVFPTTIPNVPAMAGATLYAQWLAVVSDPSLPNWLLTSRALELTIQP